MCCIIFTEKISHTSGHTHYYRYIDASVVDIDINYEIKVKFYFLRKTKPPRKSINYSDTKRVSRKTFVGGFAR